MSSDYAEPDYRRIAEPDATPRFLPGTRIEQVRPLRLDRSPRHVLFDFDGTLSLIREGWSDVMVPMMVEILQSTGTDETPQQLGSLVHEFVMRLNGKQTIYQMIRLAEEVRRRGGSPRDPLEYKASYHDRLMRRIDTRRESLRSGRVSNEAMMVPHALKILDALQDRGVSLYLASGTDESYVREEARLLGLDDYFGSNIHGASDDYRTFSKALVIERILSDNRVEGVDLLGFGDGYVEIQNIKSVGGTAIAVASDEAGRTGRCDTWKRNRLIGVGADLIIPDYQDWQPLLEGLRVRD